MTTKTHDATTLVLGRKLRYVRAPAPELDSAMRAAGPPDVQASADTDLFTTVLDGRGACMTDGVRRALCRSPRDLGEYDVSDTAAAGLWKASSATGAER